MWQDLLDILLYIPKKIFEWLFDLFTWFIESIPVPDFLNDIGNIFSAIPPEVAFFTQALEFNFGLGVISVSYLTRFIIRRLPFVG